MIRALTIAALAVATLTGLPVETASAQDRAKTIADPDTRAWWRLTEQLSADDMEGRDTGSKGYDKAADLLVGRLKAAGLRPAGDNGGWFQSFPVIEARVETAGTTFTVKPADGPDLPLKFLHQITVTPDSALPAALDAPLTFRGYCRPQDLADASGKVVICFNSKRTGMTTAGQRIAAARAAGATGLLHVDDPYFTIEPARWPAAYARTVRLATDKGPAGPPLAVMTLNADVFAQVIAGSGQDAAAILKLGGARQPMPSFDVPARLQARLNLTTRQYAGKNVLAVLPGRDARLKREHLVLSAHLDGYGHGEPVAGDDLYNGALDDAAYVALLARFAERHKRAPLGRSVLLAAFAGEEKGLLGARWFIDHPTVPKDSLIADINLDQLRPLFPLEILTMLAPDRSTLLATVESVAGPMGIRIQHDPEPERGLLQRADHWPFLQAGIPATGFIFGYVPGTEADHRYREWYRVRYHRPQDDVTQPMDFEAAGKFNRFFYKLAETLANAPTRPAMTTAP